MSKVAIFLCVAAFATVSNAASVASELEKAQKAVDSLIENTVEAVKATIDETKQKSAEVAALIEAQADKYHNKISDDVASKVQQAWADVAEITSAAGDVNISECSKLSNELASSALKGLSEMRKCFGNNREKAAGYVKNMLEVCDQALHSMRNHHLDARKCMENVTDLYSASKALICTNKVAAAAALTAVKIVPLLSVEATKLTVRLASVPANLSACTAVHALNVFYYEAKFIASRTTKCVQQKIEEVHNRKPSSTAPAKPQ